MNCTAYTCKPLNCTKMAIGKINLADARALVERQNEMQMVIRSEMQMTPGSGHMDDTW